MVKYEEIGTTDDNTGINGFALLCKEGNEELKIIHYGSVFFKLYIEKLS